jgi:hypothetical protein
MLLNQDSTSDEVEQVEPDEMKIKHIESTTETTVLVRSFVKNNSTESLRELAYNLRGAIKTRRDLISIHRHEKYGDWIDVTIAIKGYTCTQWHHQKNTEGVKQNVEDDISRRMENADTDWHSRPTIEITLGDWHDVSRKTSAITAAMDPPELKTLEHRADIEPPSDS